MTIQEQIERLEAALAPLAPSFLKIIDDSYKHAGHAGAKADTVTHIRVQIASAKFNDLSRVAQQRLVLQALSPLMPDPLHAVQVSIISCS